ncbi:MAG TPA: hypothetical protein ENG14_06500 [Thermodesulforhabdus norvegica]|uniref:DUF5320 domain-containing protein n=1 Tax=Thermodesulforhabdus norvegica TaxID=39841 RepID=A0A7C1AZ53_9BACT|nr:hypothetical protein [Thermodesulforhabdus norvegica]
MPAGDRTGPLGLGPRTGRGAGFCSGYGVPGYMNPWPGRGWGWRGRGRGWGGGFGYGRGRGWRWRHFAWWGYPPWSWGGPWGPFEGNPEAERDYLRNEAEALREELNRIEKRLSELESEGSESE